MDRGKFADLRKERHIKVHVSTLQQHRAQVDIGSAQVPIRGWLQAFEAHPRIGDMKTLRTKHGAFGELSRDEQAAASSANQAILGVRTHPLCELPHFSGRCNKQINFLIAGMADPCDTHGTQELAYMNQLYEQRFGHIFIICASGKTANEMLAVIKSRHAPAPFVIVQWNHDKLVMQISQSYQWELAFLGGCTMVPSPSPNLFLCAVCRIDNDPHEELLIAAAEQMKITELRLHKLLSGSRSPSSPAEPAAYAQVERRAGQIQAHLGALLAQPFDSSSLLSSSALFLGSM